MISTKKLVKDFNRKRSKSSSSQDLEVVDVIAYLNEAQEYLLENLVDHFEVNSKVSSVLRKLEEKRKEFTCEEVDDLSCISKYPEDLYRKTGISVLSSVSDCKKKKLIPLFDVQTDDEGESIRNPYDKADFYYEQIFGNESGEGYYIFHQKAMEIEKVYLSYIRKPQELHAPSLVECVEGEEFYYDYCGRKITQDSDLEFGTSYTANTIVNIAVLLASAASNDVAQIQNQLNSIINIQKIK